MTGTHRSSWVRLAFALGALGAATMACQRLLAAPTAPSATRVSLPGGAGGIGFDDMQLVRGIGRVAVPAGRSGSLDLVDPATRAITTIGGFSTERRFGGGHGEGTTSVDEGDGFLFATDRTARRLDVVDEKDDRIVASAALGAGPDYVRWVAPTGEVWVTEPSAERIEIFSLPDSSMPARGTPPPVSTATLAVPGGPESLVIDAARGRAYTHLWSGTTLAIDLAHRKIVARWKNGCEGSQGIALDAARGFLFVGCAEGKAVVLDAAHDGKILSTLSSGRGVDIIAYSPSLGHLYLPGADSATMAILGVSSAGHLSLLSTVATAHGAHCAVADDHAGVWVCDPDAGDLLYYRDPFPASR